MKLKLRKNKETHSLLRLIRNLILPEDGLFYINGPQTLPEPLSPEEEASLCAAVHEDVNAKNKLIEHNLRLVVYIAKKFDNTTVGTEDLISIGTMGLIKAVNTFKCEKQIKLATYASRCIENEILMFIRKNSPTRCEISLDEPLNTDKSGNELMLSDLLGTEEDGVWRRVEQNEEKQLIKKALNALPERDSMIIKLRYGLCDGGCGEEKTQKEVAGILGISQSYISRLEKKITVSLKKELFRLSY